MLLEALAVALALLAVAAVLTLPAFSGCSVETGGLAPPRLTLSSTVIDEIPDGLACRLEVVFLTGRRRTMLEQTDFTAGPGVAPFVTGSFAVFSLFVVDARTDRLLFRDLHATVAEGGDVEVGLNSARELAVVSPASSSFRPSGTPPSQSRSGSFDGSVTIHLTDPEAALPMAADVAQLDLTYDEHPFPFGRPDPGLGEGVAYASVPTRRVFRHRIDPPPPGDSILTSAPLFFHPTTLRIEARVFSGEDLLAGPRVEDRCSQIRERPDGTIEFAGRRTGSRFASLTVLLVWDGERWTCSL